MATFYRQDIVDIELNSGTIFRSFLNRSIGKDDNIQDRFGVRLFRDGKPVSIDGSSCTGLFMAPNGQNILISGSSYTSANGNVAWVQLPAACYNYEGQFTLSIKLTSGTATGTIRIIDGVVVNTGADGAVAPTDSVPTYQEIIAVYEEMLASIGTVKKFAMMSNGGAEVCPIVTLEGDFTDAHYYDLDGVQYSSDTWISTPLIACNGYHGIGYNLQTYKSNVLTIAAVQFYDENQEFLSAFDPYFLTNGQRDTKGWVPIPEGAYFFRATTTKDAAHEVTLYKSTVPVDLTNYKTNETTIYNYDGSTFTSSTIMYTTYYIPVCGFKSVKFYGAGFHNPTYALETVTFFNSSLQRISGVLTAVSNNNSRNGYGIAPVPEGAKWLKLFYQTNMTNPPPSLSFINTEGEIINITCIGDSITEGYLGNNVIAGDPYPKVIQEKLGVGFTVYNAGVGGTNAATYWTTYKQYLVNLEQADVVIVMLGLNGGMGDTFDTDVDPYDDYNDYANTITGYTCKLIEWIQEQNPDASIVFATPTYASKTTANETQAEAQIANIPGLVQRYNIPVIDIRNMMGINEKNYTHWLATDKVHGKDDNFYHKLGLAMKSGLISILNVP